MRWAVILCLIVLGACSRPVCPVDTEPGETGRVVRVSSGVSLALDTGQVVRLVSLGAPRFVREDAVDNGLAEQSRRHLADLSLGRDVQLCYPGLTRDRYDRALAHVYTRDARGPSVWLNHDMLETGHAWLRFYPDTLAQVEPLQTAERSARLSDRGVWSSSLHRPVSAASLDRMARGFHLVTGLLGDTDISPLSDTSGLPPDTVCQRALQDAPLILAIGRAAAELCARPSGETYLLRGWVSEGVLRLTLMAHAEPISRQ